MNCETCLASAATVHITERQEGLEGESHLCEPCARTAGFVQTPPVAPSVRRLRDRCVGNTPLLRAVRAALRRAWFRRNRGGP